jgi:hypothetical protein
LIGSGIDPFLWTGKILTIFQKDDSLLSLKDVPKIRHNGIANELMPFFRKIFSNPSGSAEVDGLSFLRASLTATGVKVTEFNI